jgi:hypothetical protein
MKHTTNPAQGDYTLCGVAYDCNHLDSCAEEDDVNFAGPGELVTCDRCREVIAFCKQHRRNRVPTSHGAGVSQ